MAKTAKWVLYIEIDQGNGYIETHVAVCSSEKKAYEMAIDWAKSHEKEKGIDFNWNWPNLSPEKIVKKCMDGFYVFPFEGINEIHDTLECG